MDTEYKEIAINLTKFNRKALYKTVMAASMKENDVILHFNSSNKKPEVSCIVIAFNASRFLKYALKSLLKQDFEPKLEIFISYDRGTTDNTLSVINEFIDKNRSIMPKFELTLLFHNNTTLFRDRELSLRYARGNAFCFLDYDNIYFSQKISKQYGFMKSNKCHFLFSSQNVIDESGKIIKNRYLNVPPDYKDPNRLLLANFVDANEIMFDRAFYLTTLKPAFDVVSDGLYNDIIEDYFINSMAALSRNINFLPETLGSYRFSRYSITPHQSKLVFDSNSFTKSAKFYSRLQLTLFAITFVNSKLEFYGKDIRFNYVSLFSPKSKNLSFHFLGDFGVKSSEKLPIRLIHFGLSAVYAGIKVSAKYAKSKFINILFKKS